MSNQQNHTNSLSYKDAGVDIEAGDALVRDIAPHAKRTRRSGAEADLGGFGGLFDLKAAGFTDPVLVAATDGVGTKLELAKAINMHRGLGVDLVAMCANDILAQGAIPLFFLDYFATGKLENDVAADVIAGIADGCIESDCALIGGETAEMPGLYGAGSYDLAGFCVGAAERDTLLAPGQPKAGDVAIGIPSSGVHSNGFSLVRKIIDVTGADLSAPAPFDPVQSLGEALITPTRIYQKAAKAALDHGGVSGIVHVTGGGLIENPPRVYSDNLAFDINCALYDLPPVFGWLRNGGNMELHEMARTFNCGIGLIIFASPDKAETMLADLHADVEPDATIIGALRPRNDTKAVVLNNSHHWQGK